MSEFDTYYNLAKMLLEDKNVSHSLVRFEVEISDAEIEKHGILFEKRGQLTIYELQNGTKTVQLIKK